MARSPETANSRPIIRMAIHPGSARTCTSEISAADTSSLSAIGSSSVPMVVTCFQRRARYPSSRSVAAAERKIASASHSLVTVRVPSRKPTSSCTSAATNTGTKKIRRIVSMLGIMAQTNYNPRRCPTTTGESSFSVPRELSAASS